jgi:hypothetical protein
MIGQPLLGETSKITNKISYLNIFIHCQCSGGTRVAYGPSPPSNFFIGDLIVLLLINYSGFVHPLCVFVHPVIIFMLFDLVSGLWVCLVKLSCKLADS